MRWDTATPRRKLRAQTFAHANRASFRNNASQRPLVHLEACGESTSEIPLHPDRGRDALNQPIHRLELLSNHAPVLARDEGIRAKRNDEGVQLRQKTKEVPHGIGDERNRRVGLEGGGLA